jgi:streptomycin 6-kinase
MDVAQLECHIARWRLAPDGTPFETHSSWLQHVTHDGKPALLKVFKPHSDEIQSAAILRHWGESAVRVYEGDETAIVIERIAPGTTLSNMVATDDDGATHIWCDVVEKLHVRPAPEGFKDLVRCGRSLIDKPYPPHPLLTQELFESGRQEFLKLLESQSATRVLLHTDLHHTNILKDATRGWLVIDPKGYVGELEFETSSFLHNPTPEYCQPSHLERRVRILSQRLGMNEDRLLRWCFAHDVLSAVWSIEMPVFDPAGGIDAANAALEVLGRRART